MPPDLPFARRDAIAARLAGGEAVVAAALASQYGVSEDAIRRDLRALAADGRCRRVYGGALPISAATRPMAARVGLDRERKLKLARAAVPEIGTGALVFIDSGSTNLSLVELLPDESDTTVATNSVEIAKAVLRRQDLRLIVIGGLADPVIGGCVDAAAVQAVERMRFDHAVIGACSVSPETGLGAFHFADATFKRAAIAAAGNTIVLALTEKFAERAQHRVAALGDIDVLVIEGDLPQDERDRLASSGCRITVAADGKS